MDALEIRDFLEKLPGIQSAAALLKFSCWRETKDGGSEEVIVTILDRGSEGGSTRYGCEVTTADGRRASGNSSYNVQATIAMVHWSDLDK
jgi:hypothetical protein